MNLVKLTPPSVDLQVQTSGEIVLAPGQIVDYSLRMYGVTMRWQARIVEFEPLRRFVDMQERGPYRYWRHIHEFEPVPGGTVIRDTVDYELPLGYEFIK